VTYWLWRAPVDDPGRLVFGGTSDRCVPSA